MTTSARVLGDALVRLWGLSSHDRIARQLQRAGGVPLLRTSEPTHDSVVLLRGDYVYDDRVVAALVRTPGVLLRAGGADGAVVAAHVPGHLVARAEAVVGGAAAPDGLPGLRPATPESLVPAYQEQLRKLEPAFVRPITPETRRELEDRLFAGAYKGVTDLVTKWVWPRPARWVTRRCASAGIRANHVTVVGASLALVAGVLFAVGAYGAGLAIGWIMTFLDTVDGKLARVTVSSSRFGHLLDHGTDIVHPPLWYVAWGLGLAGLTPAGRAPALGVTLGVIVAGYVVGRLVEGAFFLWLGGFSIFAWRRIDSYCRLVTARRNPNLLLLTAGAVAGQPDLGLVAVAVWTAVSSAVLLVRLGLAIHARATSGPLSPWLAEAAGRDRASLSVRLFGGLVAER
jgi:phosphatidylglycerophosphate synthase